eukprot:950263-Amphidinium_carterae.1
MEQLIIHPQQHSLSGAMTQSCDPRHVIILAEECVNNPQLILLEVIHNRLPVLRRLWTDTKCPWPNC